MHNLAASSICALAALAAASGCESVRPCAEGSIFLQIVADSASATATTLTVDAAFGGKTTTTHLAYAGQTHASAELDFADGYPAGATILLTTTAYAGTTAVARGSQQLTLPSGCGVAEVVLAAVTGPPSGLRFPRTFGVAINMKDYDQPMTQARLANLDLVVLGFYKGWKGDVAGSSMRPAVQQIRALNPQLVVGQYTILSETYPNPADASTGDLATKLDQADWWARNAAGQKVQWTSQYGTWEINSTKGTTPDANGDRWPEWYAERQYRTFFQLVPEVTVWFLSSVIDQPRVTADWNRDGVDETPASAASAFRAGHRAEWDHIRAINPGALLVAELGSSDLSAAEYVGQLEGAFFGAAMGADYSIEAYAGWDAMMSRYRALMANTRAPHLVALDVRGAADDYRLMRYGLTSCLLDDGYFSYSDSGAGNTAVSNFDELELDLGQPTEPPPLTAWQSGVYLRRFEHGAAVVNPGAAAATVTLPAGYKRFSGAQAPTVNNGQPVTTITIGPKDGLVLLGS